MDTIHEEGWVKLHRKIEKSAVFQNEGLFKVWTWCLLRANYEDRWVSIQTGRGSTEVFVKRGQFIFGRKTAAKALKMDESTVYKRMRKLENMQNCNIQSNTHYSIVTVRNYELYQGIDNEEGTGKVTPKEQASNTTKNYKNLKNKDMSGKNTPDPRVKVFLDSWGEGFLQATGLPYVFTFSKDAPLAKGLLQVHPLEALQEVTKTYFRDEQAKREGFTFGQFKVAVNRLVSRKAMDPLEQARREMAERRQSREKQKAKSFQNPVEELRTIDEAGGYEVSSNK